ncbi:hypothetical protein Pmar_PMAR027602 [Perkinsus marinus ATCC 50983]|uniref:Uncharacterized protein n=1 Tax=Perkinsus marinus (strain ATCC 50983 / TXsc) TaxID=423536 RepID=C5KC74_PERM5|nr:hypothetical protein Pmar_PMAR027602 [Perkinsus marinus ATCC 50983]EER17887.1 hypothetical protein Pmar_PMAR027602 [Perkinsus marinus ATCC 50983]|eukprot:XP_002786091.1 hypothetical protein Pmar_PMAR027602 [Perkinsus marinus ATCC 50983]
MYGNEEVDYGDDDSISSSWDDTAQSSDTHLFHGASSEKEKESDMVETNTGTHGDDLAFMKNIRAAAQMVTRASGDIDYTGRNPVDTLQRVLGVNMGNPIYKCMAFRCPKGKDLGSSVFAWARSWNVQTHPDGHDYTMVERGKPRSWDYPRVWDKICQATTNCQLDPAPLQLLALCLVAPRAISDQIANGALKDLKDHQTSDLPTNSCLLAWQDVNNKSSPSEIADAFSKFIEGCRRMVKQARDDMVILSTAERPHKYNPILLLREYVGLPGKVKEQPQPWSRVFAREKKIIEKIAEHSDGTEINWSMRRLLYVELIASSKRWQLKRESLMGCMERIRTSKCPEDVMEILTETAYEAKFTSIDTLLYLKRSSGGPLDTATGKSTNSRVQANVHTTLCVTFTHKSLQPDDVVILPR